MVLFGKYFNRQVTAGRAVSMANRRGACFDDSLVKPMFGQVFLNWCVGIVTKTNSSYLYSMNSHVSSNSYLLKMSVFMKRYPFKWIQCFITKTKPKLCGLSAILAYLRYTSFGLMSIMRLWHFILLTLSCSGLKTRWPVPESSVESQKCSWNQNLEIGMWEELVRNACHILVPL
jgi:hypothetical protein